MAVCRFFQQGYCRFGQNCRYDHIYGSKYSYHANPQPQAAAPAQSSIPTDEQLITQVQADMQSALRGGQWLLSCYLPFKEKPMFPGISDLSPEEARLFIYEAKNSNNLEQAITYMNNMFKEAKQKYEQILQPDTNIMKVLRALYNGEVLPSPFSNQQNTFSSSSNTASSIFRSAVQNTQTTSPTANMASSIFSQGQQSVFNTQPDPAKELFSSANNTNVFGQSSPPNAFGENQNASAKSLFASAVQNSQNPANPSSIFASANQSIFGSPPNQNTSPFAQVPFNQEQSSSPFAQVQNKSPFSQEQNSSPFAPVQNTSPFSQDNIFERKDSPASIFGQANKQLISDDPGIYSKIEELSETDIEAFKSDKFELGFVPELPPPYQLCTRAL